MQITFLILIKQKPADISAGFAEDIGLFLIRTLALSSSRSRFQTATGSSRNTFKNDIGNCYDHDNNNQSSSVAFDELAKLCKGRYKLCTCPGKTFADPVTTIGKTSHNSRDDYRPNNDIP